MHFSKRQIILIGIVLIFIIGIIVIINLGKKPSSPPNIKLTMWGFESKNNFEGLIGAYAKLRPNVNIEYKQVDKSNYSSEILNALASGNGPDIFMIRSKSLIDNVSKLYPVLDTQFNLAKLRSSFPKVVEDDFVYNGKIYALPLSIDSLALFYNQDYFNKFQIVYPPKTWDDFADYSQKLKVLDLNGNIIQAGAALGLGEKSIIYATDILKLLLRQSGAPIFDSSEFNFGSQNKNLGEKILDFYLSFADPQKLNYTWPKNFGNSIEAFTSGKTAMIFAYQKDIKEILKRNPYLNFGIAQIPQFKDAQVNYAYADYWGLAVSKKAKEPGWAWDFIIYATTNDNLVSAYLSVTKNPPALRSQIAKYLTDPDLAVFASQALISRSWQEPQMEKFNEILNNVINDVANLKFNSSEGIRLIENQSNQLIKNY